MYTYDNICAAVHHFPVREYRWNTGYVVCNRHRSIQPVLYADTSYRAKPLTIWYSVMMILTGLSSGLTGNKIIQGFNFCWILVFLVFMLLHNFCNDRQWGLIKYIAAAFQAVFGAIGCIAEPFMDIADYMRNERMDSDHMGSESVVGDSANATAGEGHVKKHRMLYVFIGIAIAFSSGCVDSGVCCALRMRFLPQ